MSEAPDRDVRPVLEVAGIVKEFGLRQTIGERLARAPAAVHRAVDDVSFTLRPGEIWGWPAGRAVARRRWRAASSGSSSPTRGR
jgi:hypothetical protein